MGRKIKVFVEDNRSGATVSGAVTVYKKISSDEVDCLCLRLGRQLRRRAAGGEGGTADGALLDPAAAAGAGELSTSAAGWFCVRKRFEYLKEKTDIRKVVVFHDLTPYALLQKGVAEKVAAEYGSRWSRSRPAAMTTLIPPSSLGKAGGGAVIKIG